MKLLDSLEKRYGHLAVPNVVLTLIIAQLVLYAAILIGKVEFISLLLIPKAVLGGEWWRLISFLLAPPTVASTLMQGIFLAFFWYIFWMMSATLEAAWGVFRFNLFLLAGVLFTIAGAFLGQLISPSAVVIVTPYFLYSSVFFAFATLNPNVQFLIFFVIPMKVKWLAWIVAGLSAVTIIMAPTMGDRVALLAPLLNYLLFFRDAMTQSVKNRKRRASFEKKARAVASEALHTCSVCGATEMTDPDRHFRYKVVDGNAVCICDVCREQS